MRITLTSIGKSRASRSQKLPIRDGWDKYVKDFSATAPEGLKNVY